MNIHLTTSQQTKVVVVLSRPVNLTPVWSVSDREVVDVTVADDGLSAEIVAKTNGFSTVNVRTNADLGSGFCEQNTAFNVVVDDKPNVVNFYAAIPVEKPSETPQTYWKSDE
jgi:hypothetical protein